MPTPVQHDAFRLLLRCIVVEVSDTRSASEFAISHLEGAVNIDPKSDKLQEIVQKLLRDGYKPSMRILCYCTVGYRSSLMAQTLNRMQQEDDGQIQGTPLKVFNLEGGFVKWANEGRAMLDHHGNITRLVHPCNSTWGSLLEPELRAQV
ncbi:hypothetical protein NDU88_001353 [Pleurodeles waltl]|uniref:Rhodanese domain-containing protein n=1 Tax=Pleurodeles waltl TaxID=8319 RepID=A0AAV7UA19_PLEWA|nr:hypothetical protein NDU88_001353 [Pleurodeles waltl]